MTEFPDAIRVLLACPRCRGALAEARKSTELELVCESCGVRYPVEGGIPVLLAERARAIGEAQTG
jgi:uncharacterized protein YbaR (Trm112 family)